MKNMKKDGTPRIATKRARPKPAPMPKIQGTKPGTRKLMPRVTNAAPSPRRLLANTTTSRTAPKPKVTKRAPLETKRVGGVFAVPVKPKKTIY